jgi:ABC-2 type transport system ATP-binding protein
MSAKIVIRDLVKRYGAVEAVRGVSFEVAAGEIFGLLGPNGAGKTSTLECIIGLRKPDGGSVAICGIDGTGASREAREKIGAALQSTALQDKITPREALKLFGSFYKRRTDPARLIERFSLAEKADAHFDTLSGGQRQRLALALAHVNEPEALFLDEPTAGLDPQSRRELHQSIAKMKQEGRAVLLTTHQIDEAHALCDRVAIIDRGRIVAIGKPEELIARSKALPRIFLRTERLADPARLRELPSIAGAEPVESGARVTTANVGSAMIEIVQFLEREKNPLLDLRIERPSLEDVFIELTGSSLRD